MYRIIVAGVGGQGVLSIASIIAIAAQEEGLFFKQSEIHGMSQKKGAVSADLIISEKDISRLGGITPTGKADMILGMEPLESIRHLSKLSERGILITDSNPVTSLLNYPDEAIIYDIIKLLPNYRLVNVQEILENVASAKMGNIALMGMASKFLPITNERSYLKAIEKVLSNKGERIINLNTKVFQLGCKY